MPTRPRPPIRTADPLLPLAEGEFTWQQFESFAEDYVRVLAGTDKVYRYGTRGQKQRGIDFYADEVAGRTTYQCKQWEKFTKSDAENAVAETTYEGAVRHLLLVTCEVGKDVRDTIDAHPGWEVRDIRNISADVAISLALDAAKRLLDKHFGPDWRRNFLGVAGLSTFVDADAFFGPQLSEKHLLNHTTQLVGREVALAALAAFHASETQRVLVLSGRGGIGKSRLLAAFADAHPSDSIRFVEKGVAATPPAAEELPMGAVTLVVDDAHQREDLPALFALQRQRSAPTKLLLVTRSHSADRVKAIISDAAVDPLAIAPGVALKELSRSETTQLARSILPNASDEAVDLILGTAKDSPLVAVVAARLLLRRELDLGALTRDEDFRQVVLRRFRDEVLGTVTTFSATLVQKFMVAASAIGPFQGKQHDTGTAMANYLDIGTDEYLKLLDTAESAGLLLRRGYTYRVTPDVLADFILEDACLASDGTTTGFAETLFREFGAVVGSQVLRNLGEVDWRATRAGSSASILARIFEALREDFSRGTILERARVVDTLAEVAPYQPREVLALIEQAMAEPVGEVSEWEAAFKFNEETVLRRVPEILRRVAFNLDFLPRASDILWQLGKDKPGRLASLTEHPVRILQDMAGYEVRKPAEYREALLARVEKWVEEPGAFDHTHSPLDVIDPMLARQGLRSGVVGYAWTLTPFFVNAKATADLRSRAITIIDRVAASGSLRAVLRAIASYSSLFHDLRTAPFGQPMPDSYDKDWRAERIRAVEALGTIAARETEPLVHLEILRAVQWHARHESDAAVYEAAGRVAENLPTSPERNFTEMLVDPHGWRYRDDDVLESTSDAGQERIRARRQEAARWVAATLTPAEFIDRAAERLQLSRAHDLQPTPNLFFAALVATDPAYSEAAARAVFAAPEGIVAEYLHGLLIQMTETDRTRYSALVTEIVSNGHPVLSRAAAMSFVFDHALEDAEQQALTALLDSADEMTAVAATNALANIVEGNGGYVVREIERLNIAGSLLKAHALAQVLRRHEVLLSKLEEPTLRRFVSECEELLTVEDYDLSWFLGRAAERVPDAVVRLMLRRIEKAHEDIEDFKPMPFHHIPVKREVLAGMPGYEELLRDVRNQLQPRTWQRNHYVPDLFRSIARFEDEPTLTVLSEWVDSGDPDKIKDVAQLLSAASPDFVFGQRTFVIHLLERAHAAGKGCLTSVRDALTTPHHSQMRSGSGGAPFPQDVELKRKADEALNGLDVGSPAERFYRDLAAYAMREMKAKQLRDEEIFDEA